MTQFETEAIIVPILEKMDFFVAENDITSVYVQYKNCYGQMRIASVEDQEFLSFVYDTFCQEADLLIPPSLTGYIEYFRRYAIAHNQETAEELHRRMAGNLQHHIGYFLADNSWQTVIIRKSGWRIGISKRLRFLRMPADLPQCVPEGGGDLLALLRPYINLDPESFLLFTINLVQCFSKTSAHFAIVLSSSMGSGKTTLSKLFRLLVDPSKSDVNPLSKSDDEVKNLLANNYVVCFDNTNTQISENISNILCSAITGAIESRRKLYTTSEQVLLTLRNIVLINGIHAVPRKSDLAQRSLLFELQPISSSSRRSDSAFWAAFNKDKPKILGAIFDTLVKAMNILPNLTFKSHHRMAEAFEESCAIAIALGISQNEYERILAANNLRMQALRAADPFVDAIVTYMYDKKEVSDSVTNVYAAIRENLVGTKTQFPLSPSAFSRRIREERESLWSEGIEFIIKDGASCNNITLINSNLRRDKKSST